MDFTTFLIKTAKLNPIKFFWILFDKHDNVRNYGDNYSLFHGDPVSIRGTALASDLWNMV